VRGVNGAVRQCVGHPTPEAVSRLALSTTFIPVVYALSKI
jgi:hypothetical protein